MPSSLSRKTPCRFWCITVFCEGQKRFDFCNMCDATFRPLDSLSYRASASQAVRGMFPLHACDMHQLLRGNESAASSFGQTQTCCAKFCPAQPTLCAVHFQAVPATPCFVNDAKPSSCALFCKLGEEVVPQCQHSVALSPQSHCMPSYDAMRACMGFKIL